MFKAFNKKTKKFVDSSKYFLDDDGKFMRPAKSRRLGIVKIYFDPNVIPIFKIGRKDKTGKEIFEFDVIKGNLFDNRLPTMGEVIYDKEYSCWCNSNLGGLTQLQKINCIEIIGSSLTNPELLEK